MRVFRTFSLGLFLVLMGTTLTLIPTNSWATDYRGRLGVGLSNQLMNDLPAISLKLQKSRSVALGALVNASSADTKGGYGGGLKIYRIIFDEPQLNFFGALMGAYINQKTANSSKTGFQFDLTLGSEFHFTGLSSLGFSLEFGASFNKLNDFVVETVGQHMVTAAAHFYI
jgi:hypothetical protein